MPYGNKPYPTGSGVFFPVVFHSFKGMLFTTEPKVELQHIKVASSYLSAQHTEMKFPVKYMNM